MPLKNWLHPVRGGVHAPHRKHTADCETVVMPPPETIILAMSQHLGVPCDPVVGPGDAVEVGQMVGDSDKPLSAPVHSGVSGTVKAITELLLPGGRTTKAVVIESDGEQRVHSSVKPPVIETHEDFLNAVRNSGLVGLGGAPLLAMRLGEGNRGRSTPSSSTPPSASPISRRIIGNAWKIPGTSSRVCRRSWNFSTRAG